jgi:nucleotide-binding universal stress UspA family protein
MRAATGPSVVVQSTRHPESIFQRVIVGVDGSEAGFEACREASRLVSPDGWIEAVAAAHLAEAALAGWSSSRLAEEMERETAAALEVAKRIIGPRVVGRLVNAAPEDALLRELSRAEGTLLAVGSHGHSRWSEILVGGVAGDMIHTAPCAVLIARPPAAPGLFPRTVVVGIDGSEASDEAIAAAEYLARRFGVDLRAIVATKGKAVDLARAHLRTPFLETFDERPVDVLVKASQEADLVVVGSRGLHGLAALGSVSERVAHRARSSVLVIRHNLGG